MLQLIIKEGDVRALTEAFSTEYKQTLFFREKKADYIFYFGDDLSLDESNDEECLEDALRFMVLNDKAYIIDGDKVYKSTNTVDLSVLDKYHKEYNDMN